MHPLTDDERAEYERLLAEARSEGNMDMEGQLKYGIAVFELLSGRIRVADAAARDAATLREELAETRIQLFAAQREAAALREQLAKQFKPV
jgi:hypothetical protein